MPVSEMKCFSLMAAQSLNWRILRLRFVTTEMQSNICITNGLIK